MTTILIIEDEDDIRLLLRLSLRSMGYGILEAATGAEATAHWPNADVVLLDIRLPDIDGLDLLRSIHLDVAPVIAMSAHAGHDVRAAAFDAGCVAYLTKPFDHIDLFDTIRGALARQT